MFTMDHNFATNSNGTAKSEDSWLTWEGVFVVNAFAVCTVMLPCEVMTESGVITWVATGIIQNEGHMYRHAEQVWLVRWPHGLPLSIPKHATRHTCAVDLPWVSFHQGC
jgi:hypothetical protein